MHNTQAMSSAKERGRGRTMSQPKEQAQADFMEMICKSWTWGRLTDAERTEFTDTLRRYNNDLIGNYRQRYTAYNAMYGAFLAGVGYKPLGWREAATV